MFVRVKSVLFIALLGTCLTATSGLKVSLSPEHLHSSPNKPVTFTCLADKEVSACEFLVRLGDKELGLVNPAQAISGSWDVTSSGDQTSDIPSQESDKSRVSESGKQSTAQSSDREEAVGANAHSTPRNKTGINPQERLASERHTYESVASQAADNRLEERVVSNVNASRSRKVGGTRNTASNVWLYPTATERDTDGLGVDLPSSGDTSSRRASRSLANAQPTDRDGPQPWNRAVRPKKANRQNGESSPNSREDFVGNRSLTVLQARDATRTFAAAVSRRPASPYPENDTRYYVRRHVWRHGWKFVYPPPKSQPSLTSRISSDEYRWATSSSKEVCTLTLPAVREGRHLIGCRMRLAEGGWQYATSSMDVNTFKPMGVTVTPLPVVNPNSDVSVTFKASTRMSSCNINGVNGTWSSSRTECRGSVRAESGPVWCTAVSTGRGLKESRPAFIRVRTVPTRLEFALPKTRFMEGEFFTATCAVGPLQPPAPNVSWYIGEELLRSDSDDDIPDPQWVWPWEGRTVRQSLYMTVTPEDDNLPLACQVEHPVLPKPLRKSATLHVNQDIDDGTKDCGMLPDDSAVERIIGAPKVTKNLPWVAAIYRRSRSGNFDHVCGGTLVTRRLVVSSAQCFWDASFSRIADPSLFRVALGSKGRDWTPSDVRVQSPGIVRIAVPKHYIGRSAFFAYDIAVLVLDSPVTIAENVLPVCIDRNQELPDLQPGDSGTVAGWGVTETGRTSPELRSIELPYVSSDDCYQAVNSTLHRFITYDKFCAGFRNQAKSVCPGDSGGGLIFYDSDSGRHYLRGIASVAFTPIGNDENCYADLYTGFTLVSEYTSWIFKQAPPPPVAL